MSRREEKFCSSCGVTKPVEDFNKDKNTTSGLRWDCRQCSSKRQRQSYIRNREARIAGTKRWRSENKDKHNAYLVERRRRTRKQLIDGYGGVCSCCGEPEIEFLTVEHLNGDGRQHRERVGGSLAVYRDIIARGFPDDYTVLCMNCNYAKRFGVCPHEKARTTLKQAKGESE